jgi:hypothetical protein
MGYSAVITSLACPESSRAILNPHGCLGQQIDIRTAYIEQSAGLEKPGKETWVMKLLKSINGVK